MNTAAAADAVAPTHAAGAACRPPRRARGRLSLAAAVCLLASGQATTASAALEVTPPTADTIAEAVDGAPRHGPFRFAHRLPLGATLDDGTWDEPISGTVRWQLHLRAEGAHSISLALAHFSAPDSAQLFLRGAHSDVTQGPYRPPQTDAHSRLWTALVPDEEAVLELLVPADQREQVALQLDALYYGFRSPLGVQRKQVNVGGSGDCNIDVACLRGTEYDRVARSVALLTFGAFACTGNLVNNTAHDGEPLLLTAHHCGLHDDNTAASLVVYWNAQAPGCNAAPHGDFSQSQTGASFLATHERSDHTLLRLNDVPAAAFQVFYSGWDARTGQAPAACGVSLHHPSSDLKKVAVFNQPIEIRNNFTIGEQGRPSQTSDVWRVVWQYGTTEGGSSGSGLWNAQQRLIGVLFGGAASCDNPDAPDVYGRLNVAWDAADDPDSALKTHLDPAGLIGSGPRILDGREPGAASPTPPAAVDCPIPAPEGVGQGGSSSGGSAWLPLLVVLLLLRRRHAWR